MTCFTFDTAYIVAHLQNNANERLKEAIRERVDSETFCWPHGTIAYQNFETFCWAWKHDCLSQLLPRPAVDPYPFREDLAEVLIDQRTQEVEDWAGEVRRRRNAWRERNEGTRFPDCEPFIGEEVLW